ncbi:MAG: type II toxin-antitoxin system HicB family antitoxin [Phycisphaerales bacterium]|jgi:antitoxin HicB|nr:type II toxin-antitoxin system HicB family antitoxin [Phycisphaerales bacterium]MBT7170149.1 type II toxin-antitoxin system HicB family antitoxin [Phycisphaerales bacterium]
MMTYDAKIEKDDGYYLVSFPEFPNVNTYGETRSEALANAAEALNGSIEADFERGFDLPEPVRHRGKAFHEIALAPHIAIAVSLRKLRKGRSQAEIARALNVSPQAYQKLENPRRCNPTIKTLEKISAVFGKELKVELA